MTLDDLIRQVGAASPDGDALDRLAQATVVADHLGDLADHLVGHFVDRARGDGATWASIGQSLGVSKQAVQKRFVAGEPSLDRFTNRATVVVLKGQNAARDRGHPEVTSLHLLLGLLTEWEGYAGRALEAAGAGADAVRAATEAALPSTGPAGAHHAPYAAGLRTVLSLADREALRLGHDYVGTEHLLLALLAAPTEPAHRVLTGLGVDRTEVEASIRTAIAEQQAR